MYEQECEARAKFRQEAILQSMTAALDGQLLCAASQREQINEVLRSNWRDQWLLCSQYLSGNGVRYFPGIPQDAIRKVLTAGQLKVFRVLQWQPQDVRFFAFNQNMFGIRNQAGNLEASLEFAPEDSEPQDEEVLQ